jgi:anti-sigma factor RsiW
MLRFMREHRFTQARLSEYLDGELSEREQRRVHEHISICPKCRQVFDELRRTVAALGRLRGSDPGGPIAEQVIERLRTDS